MVIYIDILLITNLILNYLLLILTMGYTSIKAKKSLIMVASSIGCIYSLISLFPQLPYSSIIISKLLICFFVVIVAFGKKNILKSYCIFIIFNIIFSGLILILWNFVSPPGIHFHNGVIYFNISTHTLIFSILAVYILINIFSILTKKVPIDIKEYSIDIYINNKMVTLSGFVDTGNFLQDTFSLTPIVICNYKSIKDILPEEFSLLIDNEINYSNNQLTNIITKFKVRLIPYKTIGDQKLIIVFKPDRFIINDKLTQVEINDIYIGLSNTSSIDKNYDVILNPMLIKS